MRRTDSTFGGPTLAALDGLDCFLSLLLGELVNRVSVAQLERARLHLRTRAAQDRGAGHGRGPTESVDFEGAAHTRMGRGDVGCFGRCDRLGARLCGPRGPVAGRVSRRSRRPSSRSDLHLLRRLAAGRFRTPRFELLQLHGRTGTLELTLPGDPAVVVFQLPSTSTVGSSELTLPGDPAVVVESPLELSGWGSDVDGPWIVNCANHGIAGTWDTRPRCRRKRPRRPSGHSRTHAGGVVHARLCVGQFRASSDSFGRLLRARSRLFWVTAQCSGTRSRVRSSRAAR